MMFIENRHAIIDDRPTYELLSIWGSGVYQREITWYPHFLGGAYQAVSGKHPNAGDATEEAFGIAKEMGYRRPRWYEFWRWVENNPDLPA